jgi:hypothetical protein
MLPPASAFGLRSLLFLAFGWATVHGTTYYADAAAGKDTNAGMAVNVPWQTLAKINATVFQPGDSILLKSGSVWQGQLSPLGSGVPERVITMGSYGAGAKPRIDGGGIVAAVLLKNQEYWEIENLEVTNDAPEPAARRGVLILGDDAGRTLHHIHLRNLEVHHVRGMLGTEAAARTTGGIAFEIRGRAQPGRFDDIMVEKCSVTHVDNCGLFTWTDFRVHPRDPRWMELAFTNVTIRQNTLVDIGKNAVVIRSTRSPLIERNLVTSAAARLHGNAIYVFGCKDAIVQHNEVYGTKFDKVEGAAFDSDYNSEGTIIQYNYSHDNEGGLVNLCNNPQSVPPSGFNDGTIVRYNISQNDVFRVIAFDGPVTNTQIYNNTIYVGPGLAPKIIEFDLFGRSGGYAVRTAFRNNIIYNLGEATYAWGDSKENVFEHNCFYGRHPEGEPQDRLKITADPQFVSPGKGGRGVNTVEGYRLRANSPCVDAGLSIEGHGGRDYAGRPLYQNKPDIGAFEQ